MLIASEEDACGERHAADGCVTHGKFLPFVIVELVGEICHPTFHLRHLLRICTVLSSSTILSVAFTM